MKKLPRIILYEFCFGVLLILNIFLVSRLFVSVTYQLQTKFAYGTSSPESQPLQIAEPTHSIEPTPTPKGPKLNIVFSLPGIGSGGGNMTPLNTKRKLRVLLYSRDVNTGVRTVKPLYSLNGEAYFDSNPYSPTYTSFLNPNFYLGTSILPDSYQIVLQTDKALTQLIKSDQNAVGGLLINIRKVSMYDMEPLSIQPQTFIVGDISPHPNGDNIMDINDYNMLVSCFSTKANLTSCPSQTAADLDDDGEVNGIDYNLMLLSFKTLMAQGYPIPTLGVSPTLRLMSPSPTKKAAANTPAPTQKANQAKPAAAKSGAGGMLAGIFLLFFILLVLAGGLIVLKRNSKIRSLLPFLKQKQQKTQPAAPDTQATTTAPPEPSPPVAPPPEPVQPTTPVQEDTIVERRQMPQPALEQPPPAQSAGEETVEGDYFIKKKSVDEKTLETWLTLTGDSGAMEGLYKGTEVTEGFAKVKGVMKKEGEKTYMLISEIAPEN